MPKNIIVSCDEKDCCEVHELDLEKVQLINWRCPKHQLKVELKGVIKTPDAYNLLPENHGAFLE